MTEIAKKPKSAADDRYKQAAQDVVEEKMRIDNFAPIILNAVESDVKLRNGIKSLVAEAVREKRDVQVAISEVVDQNQTNKIYKILKTASLILITAVITALGTWLVTRTLP